VIVTIVAAAVNKRSIRSDATFESMLLPHLSGSQREPVIGPTNGVLSVKKSQGPTRPIFPQHRIIPRGVRTAGACWRLWAGDAALAERVCDDRGRRYHGANPKLE
jgi:hypothetical protein